MFQPADPSEKFVYTYESDSHTMMDLFSSSGNIHEDIFFKNGNVDSTYQYNDTQDTTTEKYVYNGSNQLTKLYEYDYYNHQAVLSNTTSYTYDSNGNVVKTEDTDNNVETFTYYPDLVNIMPVYSPLLLFKKVNLVKTHTVTSNGYPVGSATSTYTFDDKDRISIITQTGDGFVATQTFTYY
jgi:YD repeat-containing protein